MSVRFAPSPTGRFHLGNLRTAWISHAWARYLDEPWIVRFEDIDTPRVLAGARDLQLADMAALGCSPDQIVIQSERRPRHWEAFRQALAQGVIYLCTCSRKEVQEDLAGLASAPHGEAPLYSGKCRARAESGQGHSVGWRFRGADPSGRGDFLVARTLCSEPDEASFVPSYHWACAIDDFDGGHRLLVRAWDLATASGPQREIQAWLGGKQARYPAIFHASLIVQNDGHRLEKRTAGVTLPELEARGWGADRLNTFFAKNFRDCRDFAPGEIFGEIARERSLQDLGIEG